MRSVAKWPTRLVASLNESLSGHRGQAREVTLVLSGASAVDTTIPYTGVFSGPKTGTEPFLSSDNEVVELALLLPRWQAEALENAAYQRGLTAGQMLRKMIGASLAGRVPAGM